MKLRADAVHVWRVDLDAVPARVKRLLSAGERERLARIVREPARQRRIAARGVLRALLGDCLRVDPSSLRFAAQPAGKPVLDLPRATRLHFNLSHSGALAVYALTQVCPVGVDVELLSRRSDRAGAPAHTREQLLAWVRYEAEVKRTGVGVGGSARLPKPADGRPTAPCASREPAGCVVELDVGPAAVAALATAERADVVIESADVLGSGLELGYGVVIESAAVLERQLGGDLTEAGSGAVAL